jgi:hypothetical protein
VWSQYETNPHCHAKDVWVKCAEEGQSDELMQEEIVGQKYANSSKQMRVKNDTKTQESKSLRIT